MKNITEVKTEQKISIAQKVGLIYGMASSILLGGVIITKIIQAEPIASLDEFPTNSINAELALQQEFQNTFSMPLTDAHALEINKEFIANEEIGLSINEKIKSLTITGEANLAHRDSFVRIIAVDESDNELLVYQAGFPLNEISNIDQVCEETCNLSNLLIKKIAVELSDDGSILYLDKINYLTSQDYLRSPLENADIESRDSIGSQIQLKINLINKGNLGWTAGLTSAAHLKYSDKKNLFGGWFGNTCGFEFFTGEGVFTFCDDKSASGKTTADPTGTAINDSNDHVSFDWRNRHGQNWNTPVKDQGLCGSCWAFSAIGSLEGVINAYFNQHLDIDLSEQELVSCGGGGNCGSGEAGSALHYIRNNGISTEECFPYTFPQPKQCSLCENGERWSFKEFSGIKAGAPSKDIEIKKLLNQYGPLSMSGPLSLWSHAIVLSGYGYDEGGSYWIIKNSWGADSNNDGYYKIRISPRALYGTQTIFAVPILPIAPDNAPYTKLCVDNDLDGYCNWGILEKPNNCPSTCENNTINDCNDADANITACSEAELYCGEHVLINGGEKNEFGSYLSGNELGCCGDDPDEFPVDGVCCNNSNDYYDGEACLEIPQITLLSGTNENDLSETGLVIESKLNDPLLIKAEVKTIKNDELIACDNCTYAWYVDNELQNNGTNTINLSSSAFTIKKIKLIVKDEYGNQTQKDIEVNFGLLKISDSVAREDQPVVHGDNIVWNYNDDIYLFNLETRERTIVTENYEDQRHPHIYGDTIVWQDHRNGNWDVFMYDIQSKTETQITDSEGNDEEPKIYQDKIVWVEHSAPRNKIFMHDLSDASTTLISANDYSAKKYPGVYGDKVIWQDKRNGNWDVFMYDISNSKETLLVGGANDSIQPAVNNDKLAYFENNSFYLRDIADNSTKVLFEKASPYMNTGPYLSKYYAIFYSGWDIYYYNLQNEELTTFDYRNPWANPGTMPYIYDNKFVFISPYEGNKLFFSEIGGTCADGTPEGFCTDAVPKYCSNELKLLDNCLICGCPNDKMTCEKSYIQYCTVDPAYPVDPTYQADPIVSNSSNCTKELIWKCGLRDADLININGILPRD
ncbi:MAG: C1 family peptidase [Patescibacteria group bacterium]